MSEIKIDFEVTDFLIRLIKSIKKISLYADSSLKIKDGIYEFEVNNSFEAKKIISFTVSIKNEILTISHWYPHYGNIMRRNYKDAKVKEIVKEIIRALDNDHMVMIGWDKPPK